MKNKALKKEQRKVNKIIREANKTWFDEHLVGKYKIKQIKRKTYRDLGTYYLFAIEHSYTFGFNRNRTLTYINEEVPDWFRFESVFFISKLWEYANKFVNEEEGTKMFFVDDKFFVLK